MGFRAPLDVDDTWRKIESQVGPIRSTAAINRVRHRADYDGEEPMEPIPERVYEVTHSTLEPLRVGTGPETCTTSRTLVSDAPAFAWDPNRYYRSLGIEWPYVHADRRDLMRAYQRTEGHSDDWLTYCFKQLLDPRVRSAYDRLPLGELWLDDAYVQDHLKRLAAEEAGRRSMAGPPVAAEDVLGEWGYVIEPDAELDTPEDGLDLDRLKRCNDPVREAIDTDWDFSFWQWKTYRDVGTLPFWQRILIAELSDLGVMMEIGVGWVGETSEPYIISEVEGNTVLFLNEECDHNAEKAIETAIKASDEITEKRSK